MIFYFSATGNSLHAAKTLAAKLETEALSIADAVRAGQKKFHLAAGEPLGFVFPVYAWDVPPFVTDFVRGLELEFAGESHVFAVFTCGANTGETCAKFQKTLREKGVALDAAYDLVMPDNYIIMLKAPEPEKQRQMLEAADLRLAAIGEALKSGKKEISIEAKNPPKLFADFLSWMLNSFMLGTKKFRVTEACTKCGLCERGCPVGIIDVGAHGPVWTAAQCTKCLACINRCPVTAIEYGGSTRGKARYVHPGLRP